MVPDLLSTREISVSFIIIYNGGLLFYGKYAIIPPNAICGRLSAAGIRSTLTLEDEAMKGLLAVLLAVLTILVWIALVGGFACLLWGPDNVVWAFAQLCKLAVFGVVAFIVTGCALCTMDSIDRL